MVRYDPTPWRPTLPSVVGWTTCSIPPQHCRRTLNCGCDPAWPLEGPGCIVGGGAWRNQSFVCMNYWFPSAASATDPICTTTNSTLSCISNLTQKIAADDSEHIVDVFEGFLAGLTRPNRPTPGPNSLLASGGGAGAAARTAPSAKPFFAVLWLHAIHLPHPSLPQFYHNYTDAFGDPAGDYLGTITQTDAQIGRLRQLLKDHGVADNTALWYTSDNGCDVALPPKRNTHTYTHLCDDRCHAFDTSLCAPPKLGCVGVGAATVKFAAGPRKWTCRAMPAQTRRMPPRTGSASARAACSRAGSGCLGSSSGQQ